MAKKNTSPASQPNYGPTTVGPTSAVSASPSSSKGKNTSAPGPYTGSQLGYDVGAPNNGTQDALKGLQSSISQLGTNANANAGNQAQNNVQNTVQSTVNALRTPTVSFPQAHLGGVPGQNSRQGYDEGGVYIDNGPGNYDIYGNSLVAQNVAREQAAIAGPSTPAGPPVNIAGVIYQPMRRSDGSIWNQTLDASGNALESNTTRTDMGI
jgi:hypothetical protein